MIDLDELEKDFQTWLDEYCTSIDKPGYWIREIRVDLNKPTSTARRAFVAAYNIQINQKRKVESERDAYLKWLNYFANLVPEKHRGLTWDDAGEWLQFQLEKMNKALIAAIYVIELTSPKSFRFVNSANLSEYDKQEIQRILRMAQDALIQ